MKYVVIILVILLYGCGDNNVQGVDTGSVIVPLFGSSGFVWDSSNTGHLRIIGNNDIPVYNVVIHYGNNGIETGQYIGRINNHSVYEFSRPGESYGPHVWIKINDRYFYFSNIKGNQND